jgi:hypothetical protein
MGGLGFYSLLPGENGQLRPWYGERKIIKRYVEQLCLNMIPRNFGSRQIGYGVVNLTLLFDKAAPA